MSDKNPRKREIEKGYRYLQENEFLRAHLQFLEIAKNSDDDAEKCDAVLGICITDILFTEEEKDTEKHPDPE